MNETELIAALKALDLSIKTNMEEDTKRNLSTMKEELHAGIENAKHEIIKEMDDRAKRSNDIIIFNITEIKDDEKQEWRDHARIFIREVFRELGFAENVCVPKYFRRLNNRKGATNGESTPASIILVAFYTQYEKEMILSKSKLLKNSSRFRSIRITPNLTPMQREQAKNEYALVKQRNEDKYQLNEGDKWVWEGLGSIRKIIASK